MDVHDLRMVPCEGHVNVIFDCDLPYGCRMNEKQAKEALSSRIRKKYPAYLPVINVEHSFVG